MSFDRAAVFDSLFRHSASTGVHCS
jgi:hypothetical protein